MHRTKQLVDLTPNISPLEFDADQRQQLDRLSLDIKTEINNVRQRKEYQQQFITDLPSPPVRILHVDDFSAISHIQDVKGLIGYPSRAFTRAYDGDLVAGTFDPIEGYKQYLTDYLRLGHIKYIQVKLPIKAPPYATFAGLLADNQARNILAQAITSDHYTWVIHPYMGLETAWQVAAVMTAQCNQPVKVLAPLPKITQLANNKAWFLRTVRRVCGPEYVGDFIAASTMDELVNQVKHFIKQHDRVALKLSDSASGMGTQLFSSAALTNLDENNLAKTIIAWARDKGWHADTDPPVSIEAWLPNVSGSPSIQLWIPPLAAGLPVVEGIFDQQFVPDIAEQVFAGSITSKLPPSIQTKLKLVGSQLGYVFQQLGYVGRCSFDLIVGQNDDHTWFIKFVECNGRWGGTSTPMTFINRLFHDYRRQPYVAADFVHAGLVGVPFSQLLVDMQDVIYDRRANHGWAILYNLGPLQSDGKLDVITIGDTQAKALRRQDQWRDLVDQRY